MVAEMSSETPGAVSSILNVLDLDAYSTQARLMPSLIVVMPVGIVIVAVFPPKLLLESVALGIVVNVGLAFAALFSELARDAGKRKQDKLWKDWGGASSIRLLRHRDKSISPETRIRYHAKLEKLLSLKMPTVEDEKASPSGADKIYKTCGDYLLEKTRDAKKFALILRENTSYGFRRNLWGMKPAGIFL